jgi:RNA polymerase sigma-70 factor (ECF subfamily)
VDQELEREFERRLVESSTLAFRVAYGVLRHRQDAEDVAQDAFVKAYRNFRQLRDRERFRAWLVRMTWRLAIDRQRNDRRRLAREDTAPGSSGPGVLLWKPASAHLDCGRRSTRYPTSCESRSCWRTSRNTTSTRSPDWDLPEGTVKSRLFLARQRLKELLQ